MTGPLPRWARPVAATSIAFALIALGFAAHGTSAASAGAGAGAITPGPIQHVVVLFQENHSFNDLLGRLCVDEGGRCDGTTVGEISDGTKVPLGAEPDIVPGIAHLYADQVLAMDDGAMDGWDRIGGCGSKRHLCLTQAQTGAVPTLWTLADGYAISDRTFESNVSASWGSHIDLVAGTLDGFVGDGYQNVGATGKGNACDGKSDAAWFDTATQRTIMVPACIPDRDGNGPYRPSPVKYVPTIMDSLEGAGLPWGIYAPGRHGSTAYGWSICPTFWECFSTDQRTHVRQPSDFAADAAAGALPALSIVIPFPGKSQHNSNSLMAGDNWIAQNVSAVMGGPDWGSTAIFITYDDCGCFYDAVRPPAGYGIRVPMVIVSPYAKPGFVDHADASFASMLAFTEHALGLPPLPGGADGTAYDYANAFDFGQRPLAPVELPPHPVPPASRRYLALHPPDADDDPT